MNDRFDAHAESDEGRGAPDREGNAISPLTGEAGIPNVAARPHGSWSKKGLLAVALFLGSLVAVSAFSIQRFVVSGKKPDDAESRLAGDRPSAATAEPRKLEIPTPQPASAVVAASPRIPALVPTAEESAEPIGVRRTGQGSGGSGGAKPMLPEDAPALLVSSRPGAVGSSRSTSISGSGSGSGRRTDTGSTIVEPTADGDPIDPVAATTRNLQGYQQQLQGLLDNLTRTTALATGQAVEGAPVGAAPIGLPPGGGPSTVGAYPTPGGLFGGQLQGSATPRVVASTLGNRSLTLPKGTAFTCALKTKVISAVSGLVGCQVQRNVFSDDGRVLLIERGSHMDGEYRIVSVRQGMVRIPVLGTRIRTPQGVTVDIDSPGTGQLGESGIDGYVDNRWGERIGAAMLLSLIDDSVKLLIQNQSNDTNANTVVLPSTTSNSSKLAEKVLDSTINIPPLIYQNQGGIVGIYVARDVDFSSVYELRPTPEPGRP